MKRGTLWMSGLMIVVVSLSLAGCAGSEAEEAAKEAPAVVATIEGSDLNRVTLTEHAAQRLGIETAQVTEEIVPRDLTVGGRVEEVQTVGGESGMVRVRVPLSVGDMAKIAMGQPARIVAADDDDEDDDDEELEADVLDADDIGDVEEDDDSADAGGTLYYQVNDPNHNLTPGQGVRVKLSVVGSGERRTVVPYSALIYDLNGNTWVYVSPEPLVFMRHPVTVEFVEGDRAVLSDGPPVGTTVAIVGVPELYGADTGIGK
ncbi:MAG: hypothetical protein KJ046_11150 [Anaerolineae bacterium]|mgnify:CR=1 FL=1|nr:hypothetical protein [Anaerolineae bacterium]